MNVEPGLKKIESLELDKKNLLIKLFDANEQIGRASCRERVSYTV